MQLDHVEVGRNLVSVQLCWWKELILMGVPEHGWGKGIFIIYMEIEKHLFRISERALKNENASFWTQRLFSLFLVMGILFSLCLLFGHGYVLRHNTDLSRCMQAIGAPLVDDEFYYVTDETFSQAEVEYYTKKGNVIYQGQECIAIKNKNYSASTDQGRLLLGWDQAGMFMSNDKKSALKFNNITFSLRGVQTLRKLLFNLDVLLINEILDNPLGVFPKDDVMLMIKSRSAYVFHQGSTVSAWEKVLLLGKVVLSFTVVSIVTSLYIYGTIVAAPAVILLALRCCRFMRADGLNDIFKLFPWIGIHAILRETSPTPAIKASTVDICKAILYYFLFLYLVYYASIIWIDKHLFITHTELGLQELIFGYVAVSQFAAVVFMRTRTFLKYFPPLNALIVAAVLYYAQVSDFGLKKLVCYTGFSFAAALFLWMVLRLQIPAHTTWDQAHHNTPREDRPRIGYFPLFNMAWMKSLPDQWTLMMPLYGREHFSERELALVDRNNELLAQALGN